MVIKLKEIIIHNYFQRKENIFIIYQKNEKYYFLNAPLYVTESDLRYFFIENPLLRVSHINYHTTLLYMDRQVYFRIINYCMNTFLTSNWKEGMLKTIQAGLYRYRHDLIVYSVYKTIGSRYKGEIKAADFFPNLSIQSSKLTPDIIHLEKSDGVLKRTLIFEISVTINEMEMMRKKTKKYEPLVNEIINTTGKPCELKCIVMKPDLSSMQNKFTAHFPTVNSSLVSFIWTSVNLIAGTIEKLSYKIGNIFDKSQPSRLNLEFSMPLKAKQEEENIEKYLKRSMQLSEIFHNLNKATNPFYDVYKTNSKIILKVYEDLNLNNSKYIPTLDYKPSLHMPIDPTILEYPDKNPNVKLSEEEQVIEFMTDNLSDLETKNIPAFEFIKELRDKFFNLRLSNESLELFYTGELINYTREKFDEEFPIHVPNKEEQKKEARREIC